MDRLSYDRTIYYNMKTVIAIAMMAVSSAYTDDWFENFQRRNQLDQIERQQRQSESSGTY
jgi:hypothetical protein